MKDVIMKLPVKILSYLCNDFVSGCLASERWWFSAAQNLCHGSGEGRRVPDMSRMMLVS